MIRAFTRHLRMTPSIVGSHIGWTFPLMLGLFFVLTVIGVQS